MSFNRDEYGAGLTTFGRKGSTITYSSGTKVLGATVKAVVCCTSGNVVYTPQGESATITFTGVPAGFVLPHIPVSITESGTTATLCTVED